MLVKRFAMILGICSLLGFLSGCQQKSSTNDLVLPQANFQNPGLQNKSVLVKDLPSDHQKLQVNERCIACGKCARIAPDTFIIQGGKAQVYSQEHISSSQVQQAIRMCPVSAIEIVEV